MRRALATVAVLAALGCLCAGTALLARARAARVVVRATRGALELDLERVAWVRHGVEATPASMMPGMPARGEHRLHVEVVLASRGAERFAADELVLVHADGAEQAPALAETPIADVGPGQRLATSVDFDVREGERGLRLCWRGQCLMPLDAPAPPPVRLPASAAGLPAGDAAAGERLYQGRFACASCHGTPARPGSNAVGPSLDGIARAAGARVPGLSAAEYLYQSILDPNAFIATGCPSAPCARPSAMPYYGDLLTPEDAADLIAYLERLE
jgi:mono/diheme cytochrome c family protein